MNPVIECESLNKSFAGRNVVDHFTLRLGERTTVGLVGPNGAGKTTLLSLFCGFLKPSGGSIRILGHEPQAAALKGRIGTLPQGVMLKKGIAVIDQLLLFARLQGYSKKSSVQELERITELTHTRELCRQFPETLSYGQQKKVILAQALIGNPELILLDEPTSVLDPVATSQVRTIIEQTGNQHTYVISSHNLDEIRSVCDDIIVIDKGKMIKHCSINELTGTGNCLTILLEQIPGEALLLALKAMPSVTEIKLDSPANKKLLVFFKDDSPGNIQSRLLRCIEEHNVQIIEFSRGSGISDRILELVSGQ